MRTSFLSILTIGLALALPVHAQDLGQDEMSDDEPTIASLFALGDTASVEYEEFDIDARLQQLIEEACTNAGGEPTESETETADGPTTINDCTLPPDLSGTVAMAQDSQLQTLIEAQTAMVAARAAAEVARLNTVAAEAEALLNESRLRAGTVVDAELHAQLAEQAAELAAEVLALRAQNADLEVQSEDYWQRVGDLEEQLNLVYDEAAESCRRNADAGSPLDVCDEPGHQAALERP